jgi:glycosyltransferase involved in cell wall biosynthesis
MSKGCLTIIFLLQAFTYFNIMLAAHAKPSVLLLSTFCPSGSYNGLTGIEQHLIRLHKGLVKAGIPTITLVVKNSSLHARFMGQNLSCSTVSYGKNKKENKDNLISVVQQIVSKNKITAIHCNSSDEAVALNEHVKHLGTKLFLTHHYQHSINLSTLNNLTCVMTVDKNLASFLTQKYPQHHAVFVPPLVDDGAFFTARYDQSTETFFKDTYGIDTAGKTVVTMVGNMYYDLSYKNYPLLLHAAKAVQHHKNMLFLIVGDGPTRPYLEKLSVSLGIEKIVHFLGSSETVPALLHYSDIVVLTSKNEGFGLALVEAALMQKPVIGPSKTGAEGIIDDQVTGFLFKNNNQADFVKKLMTLVKNKKMRKRMGLAGYKRACEQFSSAAIINKIIALYQQAA